VDRSGLAASPPERFRFLRVPDWRFEAAGSPKTFKSGAHTITTFADHGTSKAPEAARWSCARCQVSVGRIDGEPTLLPTSWSLTDEQALCLTCSRAQAGEIAMEAAPEASREDRVRIRRTALIEFEIDRAPEAPNRTIALACRTSPAAVAAVRTDLSAQPLA
jgi:hypothetical protein